MIRVLHVAGGAEPELGGPAVAILNYARSSVAPDVEAHLLLAVDSRHSLHSRRISAELAAHGVKTWTVSRTGRFQGRAKHWGLSAPLAWWLTRRASDFDVIVVHGAWLFSSLAGVIAARMAGKPSIMIPHESLTAFDVHKSGSKARVRAKTLLERAYAANIRLFIFASELEKGDSRLGGMSGRSVVIRCPLFDEDVPNASLRRDHAAMSPLRIGFLGRLHPKKNLDLLIESLPLIPSGVRLIVGGDGPANIRSDLHALAERVGVADRIEWRGFVDVEAKNSFFESIDVLVMPSAYESFGIVAGEAMLRGVPAVVTHRTGMAEVISANGGGLLVDATTQSLATAITELDSDREKLRALSEEAPVAAQQLTFSRIGPDLRKEYLRLVGSA